MKLCGPCGAESHRVSHRRFDYKSAYGRVKKLRGRPWSPPHPL